MAQAAKSIKAIDFVPTSLDIEQLREVHKAALDLCTAILSYLTIVIKDINKGMLRMYCCHCRLTCRERIYHVGAG
jgi:alpha-D-ribose 1-methylphosphonate 5-phosphate C-P lyase